MDIFLRAAVIYLVLLAVLRLAGKRSFSDMTTFDVVLLLIIAESVQQGLIGNDFSLTKALLLVTTLVTIDIAASLLKERSKRIEKVLEGAPLVVVEDGNLLEDRMRKARVDRSDILQAARQLQGIERLDQIKYAVLERNGGITVVPRVRPGS